MLAEPGHPLPGDLLAQLEPGFGRTLRHVRVHDSASASRAAAALDARAFTLGDRVVLARGEYRPDTDRGRGLLAHEIAHVLQAGRPATEAVTSVVEPHLEAEADRAVRSLAAGGRPVLGRGPAGHVRRSPLTTAPPGGLPAAVPTPASTKAASAPGTAAVAKAAPSGPGTAAGAAQGLPPGLTVITDEPKGIGTTELVVQVDSFTLPLEKGAGTWVQQAYKEAAAGGRLVFTPLIQGSSTASYESVAAFKEGAESYKSIWLGRYGFTSTKALSSAIVAAAEDQQAAADKREAVRSALADPQVKAVVTGLATKLTDAKCDIDHIVEKQLGGTSIPSNLQLLTSDKNQASGRMTYAALVQIVNDIRAPGMRGTGVRRLQLRLPQVTVPAGSADPSFVVENLLRTGAVVGSDAVKAAADGKPMALSAGGQGETVAVRDTGETPLDKLAKRIVPGMRLTTYSRGPQGAKSKRDEVFGELDSRALSASGTKKADSRVVLDAVVGPGSAADAQSTGAGAEAGAAAAPFGESRRLRLDRAKNPKIAFYYPYMSPGELTTLALDPEGNLTGTGKLFPTIPFLGPLNVVYTKDELKLVAPIPAEKLRSPLPAAFRFTGGELALQLSPELVPSGLLMFSVGPAPKPLMLGRLTVAFANGTLVAQGTLTPAGAIPGIKAAEGLVEWSSASGWSGKITASTASIPASDANVTIGFRTQDGRFDPYADGAVTTKVRGATLVLGARWDGQGLGYRGSVTVLKPLPLVDKVDLSGRYNDRGLFLQGAAAVVWNNTAASMTVVYTRKEEDPEGKFSGQATVAVKTSKADGTVDLSFDEEGRYWGKGSVGYQVTPTLRPVLGVELTKERRVKLTGQVALGDIPLTKMWPSPEGGKVPIIKGVGVKFPIPTPVPAVTAFGEIRGSLGLGYGVGPVVLRGVVFTGELYPLEDDPKVTAKLVGVLAVPAYGELYGTFGAYIGLEVAAGAVGAKGGIEVSPTLRISAEGGVKVAADYDKDGFAFEADAYAKGRLTAQAKVDLVADLYAAWGLFSHRWTYNAASVSAQIGPEVRLTLGRIAYAKNGEITWPSLSQIKVEPEGIDPLDAVKEMLGRGEAKEV
ncbi:DUF4157 domain-containing protein [Cellulomonas humilata]|uniref:DUF4157 domain-containing protein n=1 Tax=Cellulomonas humilata TaxID=144055 RepID=A0A7Y6A651_9CELL|nr:DUF4157 domain-containing protein [Cellulomonas humilata]